MPNQSQPGRRRILAATGVPVALVAFMRVAVAAGAVSASGSTVGSSSAAGPTGGTVTDSVTSGSVSLAKGQVLAYTAIAGLLAVGGTDQTDARLALDGSIRPDAVPPAAGSDRPAMASMSYTAYFAATGSRQRPIVFIYDGGPGSSTMSLLMESVGPVRAVVPDLQHPAGGPYRIQNNPDALLDAADLVFIDAPGTGYGSIQGRDAAASFYGIDEDAAAFDRFIRRFLTKYDRWNSPKYLFGHSYGTVRNAALARQLIGDDVDLNGIISLSQYLSIDDFIDAAPSDPGIENPFFLALPSYAAIAWYHDKVPNRPAALEPWIHEVERYALGDYASALLAGADLPQDRKRAVAARLADYTGLSAADWLKADLHITAAAFEKLLLQDRQQTIGRLDARYQGPTLDPMAAEAGYDPFSTSTSSAITAATHSYMHDTLRFGTDLVFQPFADVPDLKWDTYHATPGKPWLGFYNVLPDLAETMKRNPAMHVLVMGGYFDLSTTYLAAIYEMKHLPIPASLQDNIEYRFFPTGHEAYINDAARRAMRDRMAQFIAASSGGS